MNVRAASALIGATGIVGGGLVLNDVLAHDESVAPTRAQTNARQIGAIGGGLSLGLGGIFAMEAATGRFLQGAPKVNDKVAVATAAVALLAGGIAMLHDD